MLPGRKISLIYSTVAILFIVGSCAVFFFGTRYYLSSLYFRYLEEKARILAMERYGQDDIDPIKYRNVVQRRQSTIPTSKEIFISTSDENTANDSLSLFLSPQQIENLFEGQTIYLSHKGEVGVALLYYDNSGTFAVIVLSRNPYGDEIAHTLAICLLLLIISASLILFLVSRLWAARMVNRIDSNYKTEKLFVNNAQHEINNPLSAIQGECEVALLKERTNDDYRASIERIGVQADRISAILGQLLVLSNTNITPEETTAINLYDWFCDAAFPMVEVQAQHNFSISFSQEALRIAVKNLLDNAVKYGEGSKVLVIIDRPQVRIVNERGYIPKQEIDHIFDPFYRASNTTNIDGHGIGLTLSKSLLERFGATLVICSSQTSGTIATITF